MSPKSPPGKLQDRLPLSNQADLCWATLGGGGLQSLDHAPNGSVPQLPHLHNGDAEAPASQGC